MIAAVWMFIVHLYLVVAHPLMWAGLVSMRFGVVSAVLRRSIMQMVLSQGAQNSTRPRKMRLDQALSTEESSWRKSGYR